jgi:small subunit ribosomal protein S10
MTEGAAKKTPKAKTPRTAKPKSTETKPAAKAPAKTPRAKTAVEEHKLRIRVMAYEHKILDASVKQIMDTALRYDAKVRGPVPLPTEIKKYTVNRSPFIYKDAREQFEMRTHKRLIDIVNPNNQVIEALTNLTLPSGVNVDVKMS